jgi:hypothetical protein
VSGPEPPYEIRYSADAGQAVAALPRPARNALNAALKDLAADPMQAGRAYDARWPPQFRLVPFGVSGILTCIVLQQRRQVIVEDILWAG